MNTATKSPTLLRPEEVRRRLGISEPTLAKYTATPTAPLASAVVRLPSGVRRYREDAIEAFVRAHLEYPKAGVA